MARQRHVKPDANQPDDVQALRDLGFTVIVTHTLGDRALDFFTLGYHRGMEWPLWCQWEWKTEDGTLTEEERLYIAGQLAWCGEDVPIRVGRCIRDVLEWYGWT